MSCSAGRQHLTRTHACGRKKPRHNNRQALSLLMSTGNKLGCCPKTLVTATHNACAAHTGVVLQQGTNCCVSTKQQNPGRQLHTACYAHSMLSQQGCTPACTKNTSRHTAGGNALEAGCIHYCMPISKPPRAHKPYTCYYQIPVAVTFAATCLEAQGHRQARKAAGV